MSDSSEDEDLSRFREVVDTSFTKLINESRGLKTTESTGDKPSKLKSERYLDESTHYNDVKVPKDMQKQIGAKISAIIQRNIEFVDIEDNGKKKKNIKGGVKLFKNSEGFLSCEEIKDTFTETHNIESKKMKKKRRIIDAEQNVDENDKVSAVTVSGDYILSKTDTICWKSRRKEKLLKYKGTKNSKVLTLVE